MTDQNKNCFWGSKSTVLPPALTGSNADSSVGIPLRAYRFQLSRPKEGRGGINRQIGLIMERSFSFGPGICFLHLS